MKINRRQFLKALPAAALALTACGSGQQEAPATTDALVLDHAYPLDYARQFTADVYTDGSVLLTIAESGDKFLVRPEGAAELSVLPEGTVELRQPLENIYLVSSSIMDYFIHLDALDSIALSGTRADGWYLDEAKAAMEAGEITYAGKYSAPDYECILAAHCSLAIENTMIYHTPEVKEQLEHFGVPVLVERTGIPAAEKVHSVTKAQRRRLLEVLKCLRIDIQGPRPVEEAIVTSGGIKVSEINPTTLESKKAPGVYFAGEVLDVDAYTGGFNLQIAWSTGHAAGEAAAQDIGGINP